MRRRRRRRRLIVGRWRPLPGAAELPKFAEGGGHVDVVEVGELLSHQAKQAFRVFCDRHLAVQLDDRAQAVPIAPSPAPAAAAIAPPPSAAAAASAATPRV